MISAYEGTEFKVLSPRTFILKIGQQSLDILPAFEEFGCRSAAFLTAWNPYSQPTTDSENQAAQARLEKCLARDSYTVWSGIGLDPTGEWPGEPSVLVFDITKREASRLGSEFRQNAIVWIGSDGVPELVIIRYLENLRVEDEP